MTAILSYSAYDRWTRIRPKLSSVLVFLSPPQEGLTGMRLIIGLTGFALGVISCAVLAIVEYGAWALVLPPRSSREPRGTTDAPIDTSAGDAQGDRENSLSVLAADGVKLAGSWYPADGIGADGTDGDLAARFRGVAWQLCRRSEWPLSMRMAGTQQCSTCAVTAAARALSPRLADARAATSGPGSAPWPTGLARRLLSSRCSGAARWVRRLLCERPRKVRSSVHLFSNRRWLIWTRPSRSGFASADCPFHASSPGSSLAAQEGWPASP